MGEQILTNSHWIRIRSTPTDLEFARRTIHLEGWISPFHPGVQGKGVAWHIASLEGQASRTVAGSYRVPNPPVARSESRKQNCDHCSGRYLSLRSPRGRTKEFVWHWSSTTWGINLLFLRSWLRWGPRSQDCIRDCPLFHRGTTELRILRCQVFLTFGMYVHKNDGKGVGCSVLSIGHTLGAGFRWNPSGKLINSEEPCLQNKLNQFTCSQRLYLAATDRFLTN